MSQKGISSNNGTQKKIDSDPQIKALKALLASQTDSVKRAEIEGFISKRVKELTDVLS
jgi:hypothetical protein